MSSPETHSSMSGERALRLDASACARIDLDELGPRDDDARVNAELLEPARRSFEIVRRLVELSERELEQPERLPEPDAVTA